MSAASILKWGTLALFFVSGAPALLYQIIWQHHLYTIFGAHAESVSIIIGAFMLGLGIGSIIGGEVSTRWKRSSFVLFAVIECLIGLFGYYSLQLFDTIGVLTTGVGVTGGGIATFLLVVIPTTAMGATLPILANALISQSRNVGASVGNLYFVNTLGSAFAALGSVFFFTAGFGQHDAVFVAAILNFIVVLFALILGALASHYDKRRGAINQAADSVEEIPARSSVGNLFSRAHLFSAMLLFFSGFFALSIEILWFRVIYLFTSGRAFAFPVVLAFFLFGIAFGSFYAVYLMRKIDRKDSERFRILAGEIMLISGMTISVVFILSGFFIMYGFGFILFLLSALIAFPLGILFPLLMHAGVLPDAGAGRSVSHIYAANIVGSTLGSVGTGFILLNVFSLRTIIGILSLLSLVLAVYLLRRMKLWHKFAIISAFALIIFCYRYNATLYEKIQMGKDYTKGMRFARIVENRSGVIEVTADGMVYGSGVYDGQYSTDIVNDRNMIIRPYALSAFHADPKRILVVGLSSGSWAQVLANLPGVEHVDILEINPGHLQLIPQYPVVASLLTDPRVNIIIEDGRRYLVRNPSQKYDAIVMNTSYHWRAGATNLLSQEFLEILRAHLNIGGVLMYNTTDSDIVNKTGMTVFPYAWRIANALIVSDSPLSIDRERLLSVLREYRIDGRPVFDFGLASDTAVFQNIEKEFDPAQEFSHTTLLEPRATYLSRVIEAPMLTDDNMLVEWQLKQNK